MANVKALENCPMSELACILWGLIEIFKGQSPLFCIIQQLQQINLTRDSASKALLLSP